MKKVRFSLGRGTKTAVNLILTALVFVLIWGLKGYPLPTKEMEFRRMERENLLPPSEIIFNDKEYSTIQWQGQPTLIFSGDRLIIGVEEAQVHVAELRDNSMKVWQLEEGITPVPLHNMLATIYDPGNIHSGVPLLFLNVPTEAERAEIRIDAVGRNGGKRWYDGEGLCMAPGQWMFCAYPGDGYYGDWYADGTYTLRLYQADGSLLLEHSGTLER